MRWFLAFVAIVAIFAGWLSSKPITTARIEVEQYATDMIIPCGSHTSATQIAATVWVDGDAQTSSTFIELDAPARRGRHLSWTTSMPRSRPELIGSEYRAAYARQSLVDLPAGAYLWRTRIRVPGQADITATCPFDFSK